MFVPTLTVNPHNNQQQQCKFFPPQPEMDEPCSSLLILACQTSNASHLDAERDAPEQCRLLSFDVLASH